MVNKMPTYQDVFRWLKEQLVSAFEAEQLFTFATGISRSEWLHQESGLFPPKKLEQLKKLVSRRKQGEPLQYLLKEWEFYGITFDVGEGVLIPRPETEHLVENAANWYVGAQKTGPVLDLCTGTGCVAIALSKELKTTIIAVEKYTAAFHYLLKNIKRHNAAYVEPVQADLFAYVPTFSFDLIVSNPPYIAQAELSDLQREVRREPVTALNGGLDGLDFYRFIIKYYYLHLNSGGRIYFEIGIHQEQMIEQLFWETGYARVGTHNDYSGIIRNVWGEKGI